jgi:beta-1,4-mannosyltransferase
LLPALYKSAMLIARLLVQRLRGATIVWTVHNVHAHDQQNRWLEAALMAIVVPLVHGLIFMTEPSRAQALGAMPRLARKPWKIIPHGLYPVPDPLPTRAAARASFGLPPDARIIGFAGDIRPYKGLDGLLAAFDGTPPGEVVLFVAGRFQTPAEYADEQRRHIERLKERGHQVVLIERRLDDDELAAAIVACDVNILPYRKITNSGFALLVLSLRRRILASDAAAFRELQAELGSAWIDLMPGEPNSAALLQALHVKPSATEEERLEQFLASRSWHWIGTMTKQFYLDLRQSR